MRRFLHDNGLSLVLLALFLGAIIAQAVAGWRADVEDLRVHGAPALGFAAYLASGHFLSAVFENWESEFLQMAVYVVLTAILIQRGSPESRDPDEQEDEDQTPADALPGPVRRGGLRLWLYSHSLSTALVALFLLSFGLHAAGRTLRANEEGALHGQPPHTIADTVTDAEFWYESFQNWQSEFLSVAVLVLLGIWLREKGSPESKPVSAPHSQTGR
ncbi:hypothetical protein M2352_001404 [Azospirillum fermentarium]|uniref:DUF6766 family protein n=1 Tax=Azospirillum fermentarium TaxID=1233114 RepID=UPI0022260A24|nr:DUF6766 family protein [Azospirillum fermentarium]MCW2245813.1 hypothetical protein [Azospirillum fermentarium]